MLVLLCSQQGHVQIIAALLAAAGDRNTDSHIDTKDTHGQCPLYLAWMSNHLDAFQLLVNAGAKLNQRHSNDTLLMNASNNGHLG